MFGASVRRSLRAPVFCLKRAAAQPKVLGLSPMGNLLTFQAQRHMSAGKDVKFGVCSSWRCISSARSPE
jgi:hypothetical protein